MSHERWGWLVRLLETESELFKVALENSTTMALSSMHLMCGCRGGKDFAEGRLTWVTRGCSGKKKKIHLQMQETHETQVRCLGQEDALEEVMALILPGESHGQRSLAGYSP